jgi:hypothetical protein
MGGASWWVAPSYKVAAVGWRQLKRLAQQIPGTAIWEGDRKAEFPGNGWFQVRSADDPDTLRGEGLNRVVIDECAFVSEAAWTEAIRPALSDRKGDALLISTPKGQNWFWRSWVKGRAEGGDWKSWSFPSVSNPFLDPAEIESARHDLPERTFIQEYLAEFLPDAGGVFRNIAGAIDAGRSQPDRYDKAARYVLGVDLARVEDFTVIDAMDSTGRQVYHERFNQISWERQVNAIASASARYGNAPVYLDTTGVGDPPHEMLRKAGVRVHPYPMTNASKEALIDNLAMRIERGTTRLMDVPAQGDELRAYRYELTPSRNVRMNAPEGMHDDCVIALALAAWGASRPQQRVTSYTPPDEDG